MDRARKLAERGRYTAAPNPLVGVVIVREGRIIGEGFHARAGESHAEVEALKNCPDARGATLYATLEPCNHHGRTPPCTQAILDAGVSRVVVGHLDPDPRMRGKSVSLLREAGVEVEVCGDPDLVSSLERQNEQFFRYMASGRPFVHVKLAMTLDGRIAPGGGSREWITGEDARRRVHLLRAGAGAVLVGAGTARADDPMLDVRDVPEDLRAPSVTRLVLDPRLSLSPRSRLASTASEQPVVVFAGEDSFDGGEAPLREAGVETVPAPVGEYGLDLGFALDELARRGVRGVLVEGGGDTVACFARAGLVDKMTLFYAPRFIGSGGVPAVGELKAAETSGFEVENVERYGRDVALTLYPAEGGEG